MTEFRKKYHVNEIRQAREQLIPCLYDFGMMWSPVNEPGTLRTHSGRTNNGATYWVLNHYLDLRKEKSVRGNNWTLFKDR